MDSRLQARPPLRILCQHEGGGCAACCGVHNFKDRAPAVEDARLRRRTARVRAAWPDVAALAAARDTLLELERPDVLFPAVKVCPFAGYIEDGRVGCLIHPSRHPEGEDLRDLAVYPREVCAGHFCAPHDWLRPREADLAQTAPALHYGRVVSDAGLVKAVAALLDELQARSFTGADVARARAALALMWEGLMAWPWTDPDPARFGPFTYVGADARERTAPGCLPPGAPSVGRATRAVLEGLGTRVLADHELTRVLDALAGIMGPVVQAMGSSTQVAPRPA